MNRLLLSLALAAATGATPALAETAALAAAAQRQAARAEFGAREGFAASPVEMRGRQRTWVRDSSAPQGGRSVTARAKQPLRAHDSDAVAALFQHELATLTGLLPGSRLLVDDVKIAPEGTRYYHLSQRYQDLPVVGEDISVQVGADGEVQALLGGVVAVESLSLSPTLAGDAAVRTAMLVAAGRSGTNIAALPARSTRVLSTPELVVFAGNGEQPRLAWQAKAVSADASGQPLRGQVYADAHTGELLRLDNDVHGLLSRQVWDRDNACLFMPNFANAEPPYTPLPTTNPLYSESAPAPVHATATAAQRAFKQVGDVYYFLLKGFGRDSFDNEGSPVNVHVNSTFGTPASACVGMNAFFDPGQRVIVMGAESDITNDMTRVPDVLYHEYGHGVTATTSQLGYDGENAALHEGSSDFYAVLTRGWIRTIDRASYTGVANPAIAPVVFTTTPDDWKLGIGVRKATPTTPMRDLTAPATTGQYDFYGDWAADACRSGDRTATPCARYQYRVSGISSLALYLAAHGGAHPTGKSGVVATAIPLQRLARYYYEAHYLRAVTVNATLTQMRDAMQLRARAAYQLCDEVRIARAWIAVGVDGLAPANYAACPGEVNPAPKAAYAEAPGSAPQSYTFDASASTVPASSSIALYVWDFGDGNVGYGRSVEHRYAAPGSYSAKLTVVNTLGRSHAVSRTVTVAP